MTEVIKIENLSKVYRRPIKRDDKTITEDFWALRDVSLSVNQGDILGIIGKNGAGKSTLLKILSKITTPTSGRITMSGRVGSLLEVGTGFHPEMTGRENVYMNGNVLGMSNAEINRKFEEIVDFSGVADFLETPVKRYSSGMQTRLAFAVAAHLEPEILIIDEVLAVGDAEFQKKCLGKMEEIENSGRTILFVSHNMNAIKNLCNRCIWLKDGLKVEDSRQVSSVISKYLQNASDLANNLSYWEKPINIKENNIISFESIYLLDAGNNPVDQIADFKSEYYLNVKVKCFKETPRLAVGFRVVSENGDILFYSSTSDIDDTQLSLFRVGVNEFKIKLPELHLKSGIYKLNFFAGILGECSIVSPDDSEIAIAFTVDVNQRRALNIQEDRSAILAPLLDWRLT